MDSSMNYLATIHDDDTNMTALVYAYDHGGYAVALRDDDSGQIVPSIMVRIPTLEAAIAKAKAVL